MRRMLSALQPVQPVLCEGGIGKGLFLSKSPEHLSCSSTQTEALKTSRRLYSNYLRSQPKIFRTNLMLEHDSRGIQFPGRDPARTCGQHAVLLALSPRFLHCVLFDCNDGPHFIVHVRHFLHERCLNCCHTVCEGSCSAHPPAVCAVARCFEVGQDNRGTSARVWHMNE